MNPTYALDTNVLVSAVLGDGPARNLLVLVASTGRLVTCHRVMDELASVLGRPPLSEKVSARLTARVEAFIHRHAAIVRPEKVKWREDPRDALILGIALEAQSTLVTGDRGIIENAGRFGVRVLTVREALRELDE